jgi:hypothetical protein
MPNLKTIAANAIAYKDAYKAAVLKSTADTHWKIKADIPRSILHAVPAEVAEAAEALGRFELAYDAAIVARSPAIRTRRDNLEHGFIRAQKLAAEGQSFNPPGY